MADLVRRYDQGIAETRDPSNLRPGETAAATGAYYPPGDPERAHKLPGRSIYGNTGSGAAVKGLALAQFDDGDGDKLIAFSGTSLYSATPGKTGTFGVLASSIDGDTLSVAHAEDRQYIVTGEVNKVLESDGSVRTMSMVAANQPSYTADSVTAANGSRPSANSSTLNSFVQANKAYDAPPDGLATYAYGGVGTGPAFDSNVIYSSFSSNTDTARFLRVTIEGVIVYGSPDAYVLVEWSQNNGSSYTTLYTSNIGTLVAAGKGTFTVAWPDGVNPSGNARVRITLSILTSTGNAQLRVYDVVISAVSAVSPFTTIQGLKYAIAEWDSVRDLYGPISDEIDVSLVSKNRVTLTFGVAANANATHWVVYRTADGGTRSQLAKIGTTAIAATTFDDTFEYAYTTTSDIVWNSISYTTPGGTTAFLIPRDAPAPPLVKVGYFKGNLVGLRSDLPRWLGYSFKGFPESWPEIYVITAFPMPEHDRLLDFQEAGGSLILLAEGGVMRIDSLPEVIANSFQSSEPQRIAGAPGVVGRYASAAVSYDGESQVAWISPSGIYVTNGHQHVRIADDINWKRFREFNKEKWVLRWDNDLLCLVFAYSEAGTNVNDRYYLIHLDPTQRKEAGGLKVTGPHYGAFADYVVGQVGGLYRAWSAHPTDGKVYLERDEDTGRDASNAYNAAGESPLILTGGRRREAGWASFSAMDAALYHTDFGAGELASVAYAFGRDASAHTSTRTKQVSLAGHKKSQFDLSVAGEWHQETITHVGEGIGAIGTLTIRAEVQEHEGRQSSGVASTG